MLKDPARCETQPWRNGGAAVHMSAADVRIRTDEVRHERTDARKTRWTASLRFVTASGLTFVNKLHSIKSPIVLQSRHVYNRERKYVRKCARKCVR